MNIIIFLIVRLVLSAVMLYFVYQETGPVTTLLLALITVGSEITAWGIRCHSSAIKDKLEVLKIRRNS